MVPHGIATLPLLATFTVASLSLSLLVFAYERALVPLYGSGPTNYLLDTTLFLAAMLAPAVHPFSLSTSRSLLCAAIALSAAPNATYWVGAITARRKDPVLGPAITHAVVLGPLVFMLAVLLLREGLLTNNVKYPSRKRFSALWRFAITLSAWWSALQLSRRLWPYAAFLRRVSYSQISLSLSFLAYSTWVMTYVNGVPSHKSGKRKFSKRGLAFVVTVPFWWLALGAHKSPILPHPLPVPYTRPDYPLRILSAVQSITGLITVAEALPRDARSGDTNMYSVRYLRASHSLLGGVWMYDNVRVINNERPITDSYGAYLGDSIYPAFILQEAVRLVNSTNKGSKRDMKEGLIIGLGAGISATAFNRHGIATTIVEIDPAIYDAARQYFGLPDPGVDRVFLEDARAWVSSQKSRENSAGARRRFDFVIHDCFSGGGVPEHIYTIEFWNDLQNLMEPDGIVAVNYGGVIKSESSRLILRTLLEAFGQCRAFHDLPHELTLEKYETPFTNLVIFCTRSGPPMTFRTGRKSDYLGSPLRQHTLASLGNREVNISYILEAQDGSRDILSDKHNPLGKLQEAQGHHHWQLMREVLPDLHWETY